MATDIVRLESEAPDVGILAWNHLASELPRIGFTSHRNHFTSDSLYIGITLLGPSSNQIIELLSSMPYLRWKPHFVFRVLQAMLKLRSGFQLI